LLNRTKMLHLAQCAVAGLVHVGFGGVQVGGG
jgi:hypothetical protein